MKDISTIPALAATATSLVLPEQLAQQAADAVRELLAEAAAENTTRSYTSALRYWAGWHVHCSHFQRAIAEFLAFEADNFSTRRTVADIFGCWLPQG